MIEVAVIIVNYNTSDEVIRLIKNIRSKVKLKEYKIIVVDNNSDYKKLEKIKNIKLIKLNENVGFAGGNNEGIKSIKAKYYCLINPDIELENDALTILKEELDKCENCGIAGPQIYNKNLYYKFGGVLYEISILFKLQWIYHLSFKNKIMKSNVSVVDWVTGAFFMIKGEMIHKIGVMDESYFLYSEESDYCFRAKEKGWKTIFVKDALVKHSEGISTSKNAGFRLYYQYRSKLKFIRKHFGWVQYIILKKFYSVDIVFKLFLRGIFEVLQIYKQNYVRYYFKLLKEFIKNEI